MTEVLRRFLQWLLFIDKLTPVKLPSSDRADFVLSIFLRSNQRLSCGAFCNFLKKEFVPGLWEKRSAWGVTSMEILADISWGGILSFPLQFTRCYSMVKLLCWIQNETPPPRYTTRFGRRYDAVIEITFAQFNQVALDQLLAMLRAAGQIGEHTAVASQLQTTVYQSHTPAPADKAIRVCFLVHRPREKSRDECQNYWRIHHADLVLRNLEYIEVTRYFQIFTIPKCYDWYDDTFDGIACAEKPSLLSAMFQLLKFDSLRFNNTLVLDELNFTVDTPVMLLSSTAQWKDTLDLKAS